MRLRRKIEINPHQPLLIKTIRGLGYVFAADISHSEPLKGCRVKTPPVRRMFSHQHRRFVFFDVVITRQGLHKVVVVLVVIDGRDLTRHLPPATRRPSP